MTRRFSAPRSLRVLVAPSEVFAEVLNAKKGFGALLAMLALEMWLVHPGPVAAHLATATVDPIGGLAGLWSLYLGFALRPALAIFALGTVVYFHQRRSPAPLEIWTAASLFAYAWVPHLLLVAASAALAGLGLDHAIMPHRPFADLGWGMLLGKGAIAHSPTMGLGVLAIKTLRSEARRAKHRQVPNLPYLPVQGRRFFFTAAAVIMLGAAGITANIRWVVDNWEHLRPLMPNDQVPAFLVRSLDGKRRWRDSDLRGKVTLIDFWATWCPPCVDAMPDLAQLYQELEPEGLALLSVNVEPGNPIAVKAFAKKHRLPFEIYVDRGVMQKTMRIRTFPTVFIVDQSGTVRHVHVGATSISTLKRELQALLRSI